MGAKSGCERRTSPSRFQTPPRAFDTFTTFTINKDGEPLGETDDCAAKQREENMSLVLRMRAREKEADDGTKLYCSDVKRGVTCPYTDELVSITEVCLGCEKIYKDDPYYLYCIRGSSTSVRKQE